MNVSKVLYIKGTLFYFLYVLTALHCFGKLRVVLEHSTKKHIVALVTDGFFKTMGSFPFSGRNVLHSRVVTSLTFSCHLWKFKKEYIYIYITNTTHG